MHFQKFRTHTLVAKEIGGVRTVEGIVSAEIVDKDTEITVQKHLMKGLKHMLNTTKAMSLSHTNRIVGAWDDFEPVQIIDPLGNEVEAIKGTGHVHKGTDLYDQVWEDVKSGELRGFSFGGATKTARVPAITESGNMAYQLKDLEVYEVAICKSPSVPWALITNYNQLAKSVDTEALMGYATTPRDDNPHGDIVVQCEGSTCFVNQSADRISKSSNSEDDLKYTRGRSKGEMVRKSEDEKDDKKEESEDEKDENDSEGRDENNEDESKDKAILDGFAKIMKEIDKSNKRSELLAKQIAKMGKRLERAEKKSILGFKVPKNTYVDEPNATEKPEGDQTAPSTSEFDIAGSGTTKEKGDRTFETPQMQNASPEDMLRGMSANPLIEFATKLKPGPEAIAALNKAVIEDHFGMGIQNPNRNPVMELLPR